MLVSCYRLIDYSQALLSQILLEQHLPLRHNWRHSDDRSQRAQSALHKVCTAYATAQEVPMPNLGDDSCSTIVCIAPDPKESRKVEGSSRIPLAGNHSSLRRSGQSFWTAMLLASKLASFSWRLQAGKPTESEPAGESTESCLGAKAAADTDEFHRCSRSTSLW